jgi:hypothetical protein
MDAVVVLDDGGEILIVSVSQGGDDEGGWPYAGVDVDVGVGVGVGVEVGVGIANADARQ